MTIEQLPHYSKFLQIKTTIPHQLLITGFFEFATNMKIHNSFKFRKRKYSIIASLKMVDGQDVPPSNNYFSSTQLIPSTNGLLFKYKYYVTNLTLTIELVKEELLHINRDNCHIISSEIFQNIMIDFTKRYNRASNGRDYLNPLSNTYGPMICLLYDNNKPITQEITGTFFLSKNYIGKMLKITDKPILEWQIYFNKAREKYNLCEYLDSILWCSISLESYIVNQFKENNLWEIIEKAKRENKKVSFFKEVRILEDNSIISKKDAKELREIFSTIKESRNSIVHGDVGSSEFDKKSATNIIEHLFDYYSKVPNSI